MRQEFEEAFESWLKAEAHVIALKASRAMYRSIWRAFVETEVPDGVSVQGITSDMVARYLVGGSAARAIAAARRAATGPQAAVQPAAEHGAEPADQHGAEPADQHGALTIRYQARVARLIDKVMAHHAQAAGIEPAAGSVMRVLMKDKPDLRRAAARAHGQEPEPEHLSAQQHQALKRWLVETGQRDMQPGARVKWSDARDRTSLALQLGAGLTPSDVRALLVDEVTTDWAAQRGRWRFLRLPKNGTLPRRQARVDDWAALLLDNWITTLRDGDKSAGLAFLLPGDARTGEGQWSKAGQHKQSTKLMGKLGIAGSSFMLRHSWALKTLGEGESPVDVARWLGLTADGEAMKRYDEVRRGKAMGQAGAPVPRATAEA